MIFNWDQEIILGVVDKAADSLAEMFKGSNCFVTTDVGQIVVDKDENFSVISLCLPTAEVDKMRPMLLSAEEMLVSMRKMGDSVKVLQSE